MELHSQNKRFNRILTYLKRKKRRDHRKLGKELELFAFLKK
jgi:threonyl-tRNA synthetase